MTSPESAYATAFLEGSLGLASESLRPEDVPSELVDGLMSALRGSLPKDSSYPSLEVSIKGFLSTLERSALDEDGFFVRKARWPNAAPVAVCLTHDVDNVERPMEHILKVQDRFSKADLKKAKKGLLSLYDNIELIGEREGAEGFRSSFYLLSSNYPLDKVRATARRLHARGWEIGLHGDFGTHDSEAKMGKAVERLTKGIGIRPRGLREHYLRFDFGKSWRVMEGAGFDYDTTVGNNETLGFRLGLATPFHPPDAAWRPMRLLELPLSLMDTTLWGYLKKDEEEGFKDVMKLMGMVEEVEGLFTLLWHQEAVRMKGGRSLLAHPQGARSQKEAVRGERRGRGTMVAGPGGPLEAGEGRQADYPWRTPTGGLDADPYDEAGDQGEGCLRVDHRGRSRQEPGLPVRPRLQDGVLWSPLGLT